MTMGDRERLITRIRQVRRLATVRDRNKADSSATQPDRVEALERRMAHLEQLVEGLQDSVHRESERHSKLITDLQAQVQPGAMGAALAEDARDRGL
jgi:uncharacterized coiled-coil protein SlyX